MGSIRCCLVHCSCSSGMLLSSASVDVVVMIGASLVDGSAFLVSSTVGEPLSESVVTATLGAREEVALVRSV